MVTPGLAFSKRRKAWETYHWSWVFCCSVGPMRLSAPFTHMVSLMAVGVLSPSGENQAEGDQQEKHHQEIELSHIHLRIRLLTVPV